MNKFLKVTVGTAMTALVFKAGFILGMRATSTYIWSVFAVALSETTDMSLEDAAEYITETSDSKMSESDLEKAKAIFKKLVKKDLGINSKNDKKEI